MTGHKIKLPAGTRIKDGKVGKGKPKLSRPAQYKAKTKQTWRAVK